MVAAALARTSPRKDKPYIVLNCAAIPSELFESELFGHEKGAFTNAYREREGKFKYADGGTMFLDEIADMPLHLQPKLLRAIEYGTFQRVGSNETLDVDVRFLAATSRDLKMLADEGEFRYDLYDRLNVVQLYIPSLRERRDDIPLLARHFVNDGIEIGDDAMELLCAYEWPGNVRELKSIVERLSILSSGRITAEDVRLNAQIDAALDGSGRNGYASLDDVKRIVDGRLGSIESRIGDVEIAVEKLKLQRSITDLHGSELHRLRRASDIEAFDGHDGMLYSAEYLRSIMAECSIFTHRPQWTLAEMLEYAATGRRTIKRINFTESARAIGDEEVNAYIDELYKT